jgi:glutathione synthase/RimK-type ligase-like ATP-grasp enzyme
VTKGKTMTVIILRRPKLGRATKYVVEKSTRIDKVCRNDKPLPQDLSLVFRWGTTSNVPCNHVVNTAEAIHRVNDKAGFRSLLMNAWADNGALGEPLCPYTYTDGDADLDVILNSIDTSIIVRPRVHAQGKHVYLASNQSEFDVAVAKCGPGWYASEYVNKVAEYRVTFVQGRVVWVAKKTPGDPNAIAWNVSQGGRFDNVAWGDWPLRAIRVSREAFNLSGLDFGAVDVMVDADGRPYVLEINSAPSQTSPYRQECMAKAFDYIVEHGKAAIPVIEEKGGWRKFIHPALTPEATMVNHA